VVVLLAVGVDPSASTAVCRSLFAVQVCDLVFPNALVTAVTRPEPSRV
jgi:hypothetical protein